MACVNRERTFAHGLAVGHSDLDPVVAKPRMPASETGPRAPHRVARTEPTLHEVNSSHCFQRSGQRKRGAASVTEAVAVLGSPKGDRNGELGMSHSH